MKPYFNEILFSDVDPYELVEVISPKKVAIRAMNAKRINNPVFDENGYCVNNDDVKYSYESDEKSKPIIVTKRKDGRWYRVGVKTNMYNPRFVESDEPCKYHDYSF